MYALYKCVMLLIQNGKGFLYYLLDQLENGMKTLPMFQPECSGLLQGKDAS